MKIGDRVIGLSGPSPRYVGVGGVIEREEPPFFIVKRDNSYETIAYTEQELRVIEDNTLKVGNRVMVIHGPWHKSKPVGTITSIRKGATHWPYTVKYDEGQICYGRCLYAAGELEFLNSGDVNNKAEFDRLIYLAGLTCAIADKYVALSRGYIEKAKKLI